MQLDNIRKLISDFEALADDVATLDAADAVMARIDRAVYDLGASVIRETAPELAGCLNDPA